MNVIIGSSRCRDMKKYEPLKSNNTVEVWSRPGGRYKQMKYLVDDHVIYNHGGPSTLNGDTHIYVMAGLCDITTKLNNKADHYTEVIFQGDPKISAINVLEDIKNLQKYIHLQKAKAIFCTIVPSHLASQNLFYLNKRRTSYHKFEDMYEEMQMEAMKTIDIINVEIPQINQVLGLATPMMHRSVFHIKKGKSYFQHSLLPDGCHAGEKASNLWAKYLNRAIVLNHS